MAAAIRSASVVVTATGFDGMPGERQLSQVADGAILVNVGHRDREIDAPQLFDPFSAIMLGLDAILSGQTADLPNGVQRYPRPLEARVARALATGST
jgi:adenosylhomocysteinase